MRQHVDRLLRVMGRDKMLVLCIEIDRLLFYLHFIGRWVPAETMLERLLLDVLLPMHVGHSVLVVIHLVICLLEAFITAAVSAILFVLREKDGPTDYLLLFLLLDGVSGVAEVLACA